MKKIKRIGLLLFTILCMTMVNPAFTEQVFNVETVQAAAKLNKTKAILIKGQSLQLKVNGNSKKVTWSSSRKNVATVTSKGRVTARGKGVTVITAKVGNKKYTCQVTVETPKLSKTSVSMYVGGKYNLKVTGTKQRVTWSSNNKSVATVSSKGVVVAKKAGTARVTAKVGGKNYVCNVSVKKKSNNQMISESKLITYAGLGWLTLDEDSLHYYNKIPKVSEIYVDGHNTIWFHYTPKTLDCWAEARIVPENQVQYSACYHPSIANGKALQLISYTWSYVPNVTFVKSIPVSKVATEKAKLKKAQEYIIMN